MKKVPGDDFYLLVVSDSLWEDLALTVVWLDGGSYLSMVTSKQRIRRQKLMTFATMRSGMVMAIENGQNGNSKNGESST